LSGHELSAIFGIPRFNDWSLAQDVVQFNSSGKSDSLKRDSGVLRALEQPMREWETMYETKSSWWPNLEFEGTRAVEWRLIKRGVHKLENRIIDT
jgi:hypothetical protein